MKCSHPDDPGDKTWKTRQQELEDSLAQWDVLEETLGQWDPLADPGECPNRRTAVRYVRDDIRAVLRYRTLLSLRRREQAVRLLDLSSRGAAIASPRWLRACKKVTLKLRFEDGTEFSVDSRIVRKAGSKILHYGLAFEQIQRTLADHILKTQSRLVVR